MIEIDDIQHLSSSTKADFLSDAAKSGFDDDAESFALGRQANREILSDTLSLGSASLGNTAEQVSPLSQTGSENVTPQSDMPQILLADEEIYLEPIEEKKSTETMVEEQGVAAQEINDKEPINNHAQSNDTNIFFHAEKLESSELTPEDPAINPSNDAEVLPIQSAARTETFDSHDLDSFLKNRLNSKVLESVAPDDGPSFEEITKEISSAFPSDTPNQAPPAMPSLEELNASTFDSEFDTSESNYVSAFAPTPTPFQTGENEQPKVISIPDADEQRRRDTDHAARQNAIHAKARQNNLSRGLIAASFMALFLMGMLAAGYWFFRKSSLGSTAGNVWSKISGQDVALQDTTAIPLNLAQNSRQNGTNTAVSENPNASTSIDGHGSNNSVEAKGGADSGKYESVNGSLPAVSPNTTQNASRNMAQGNSEASVFVSTPKAGVDTQASAGMQAGAQIGAMQVGKTVPPPLVANINKQASSQASQNQSQESLAQKNESQKVESQKVESIKKDAPKQETAPTKPLTKSESATSTKPKSTTLSQAAPTKSSQNAASKANQKVNEKPNDKANAKASNIERQKTQEISGVFAIQVYASPSLDDAQEWLERLKERGMINPLITSQVIRGQTVYRVRFGLYNTLQAAERDAAKFGYVGAWVVRLR